MTTNFDPADFAGSCVACFGGTDTGLAVVGRLEFVAAVLVNLGLEVDEAVDFVNLQAEQRTPTNDGYAFLLRVCEACARPAGLKVALAVPGSPLPSVQEPAGL